MQTFLHHVAADLMARFGGNLSRVAVVFPNKRAGIFFDEQLARLSDAPVWSPSYLTISELFQSFSALRVADPIKAVCRLHSVYAEAVPHAESLDRFYGWGEILLADFDDVDKNRAEADRLFRNIDDIKALDDSRFLTAEQERALQRFFADFTVEDNSRLKEKFLVLWNAMSRIYHQFNERLEADGEAYEGALYRRVIELAEADEHWADGLDFDAYAFVGFNVLNRVETSLFQRIQKAEKAIFYWDYDTFYTETLPNFEAGEFIRRNLKLFPNALPHTLYNNFAQPKTIEVVAASTENAQVRHLPAWLSENCTPRESETAVVLCNESLLQPVLHALPAGHPARHVNITMGFPLTDTPVYSFLNALLALQTDGYDASTHRFHDLERQAVRNHPYYLAAFVPQKDEETEADAQPSINLFEPQKGNLALLDYLAKALETVAEYYRQQDSGETDVQGQLYREALFRAHGVLNRFRTLVEDGTLTVEAHTLKRLLGQVLGGATIPFHGEPAIGLQVMGVLETRNLDFRHLIMLSVNEGQLPKAAADTSFIPYNLRRSFGLTTIEHKVAVYAFYFYRLLQRAERITLLYNTTVDGLNQGEMSRFIRQLQVETDKPIRYLTLQANQQPSVTEAFEIEKTAEVMRRLLATYNCAEPTHRPLSPSALNSYLKCPLIFYFNQIAGIRPAPKIGEEVDPPTFGLIFHSSAEAIYRKLMEAGDTICRDDIERFMKDDILLGNIIDAAFREHYFKAKADENVEYNGQTLVVKEVIRTYLLQLLGKDKQLAPFRIAGLELKRYRDLEIDTSDGKIGVQVGGSIDRMDEVSLTDEQTGASVQTLRIVDYKTGGSPETAASMEQLFTPKDKRPGYVFQTFLYALTMSDKTRLPIAPALFFVHRSASDDYVPYIDFGVRADKHRVLRFQELEADFRESLVHLLEEIFNPAIPFRQTTLQQACEHCDYRLLCGR